MKTGRASEELQIITSHVRRSLVKTLLNNSGGIYIFLFILISRTLARLPWIRFLQHLTEQYYIINEVFDSKQKSKFGPLAPRSASLNPNEKMKKPTD